MMVETSWAATLLLVTARIGGIFMIAPVFSAAALPFRLRLLISIVMANALAALLAPVAAPATLGHLVAAVLCELAVGLTIGYAARLVFAGVQLGAFHVGQQMGFSLMDAFGAASADPEISGVMRRFFYLVAIVIFLGIGGHRDVIWAMRRTFQTVPLAGFSVSESLLEMVAALLGASFVLALKVAAPVLITLLLATVALGLLQRTLPQYNTLTVGLPARALVGLLVLAMSLALLSGLLQRALEITSGRVDVWLKTAG